MVERNAISPIVELLDVIATYAEFLQADGQDMFHVKALADDLRPFLPEPEKRGFPRWCDACALPRSCTT